MTSESPEKSTESSQKLKLVYPNLYEPTSGVIEVTAADFKNKRVVKPDLVKRPLFLIFYAPWCGHCKRSTEMWSELAIQFRYIHPILAINCENPANYSICKEFGIDRYPTVYLQKPGEKGRPRVEKFTEKTDKDTLLKVIYQNLANT